MTEPPAPREYFSERQGRGPRAGPLPHESVRALAITALENLRQRGFTQEACGNCAANSVGTLGIEPRLHFLQAISREGIWPYWEPSVDDFGEAWGFPWEEWDTDTLFDVIEVMHDLVSMPTSSGQPCPNCGKHYHLFSRTEGQAIYRRELNTVLRLNDPPFELDEEGQIIEAAPAEFSPLLDAPVPPGTEHDRITSRIDAAVTRFRTRGASIDDRRHAVRDLADVLEALRPDIKEAMLSADENALFQIANGFAIRHNNRQQRGDYDRITWLRWSFYVYLATIHAVLRVRQRADEQT